jgi:hypothetical protein
MPTWTLRNYEVNLIEDLVYCQLYRVSEGDEIIRNVSIQQEEVSDIAENPDGWTDLELCAALSGSLGLDVVIN